MQLSELMKSMTNRGPTLTHADVSEFEREIGHRLPDDYRGFLLACNGGIIERDGYWLTHVAACPVEYFCGLDESCPDGPGSLRDCIRIMRDRIPNGLLEISSDPFGNPLCIGLADSCRGRIYDLNHEEEYDDPAWDGEIESLEYISRIANSFTEYVAGLSWEKAPVITPEI